MGGTYYQTRITWPSNMRIDPSNIGKKSMEHAENQEQKQTTIEIYIIIYHEQ